MKSSASLDAHLGELGRPRQPTPAHHRSVRAAVEWSYTLLDPVEQAAFRSLAVFVGGFDADAARAVAPGMSLDVLARLVDKSLITVVPAGRIEPDTGSWTRCGRTPRSSSPQPTKWPPRRPDICGTSQRSAFQSSTGLCLARVVSLLEQWAADYGNVRAALEWAAASEPCAGLRMLAETKDLFFILGQADGSRLAEMILQRCPERNSRSSVGHDGGWPSRLPAWQGA